MIKAIHFIALKPAHSESDVFRNLPMIHPFGEIKIVTSQEAAGELSTITLTVTLRSDADFIHTPSIVRVFWRGGSCSFGSPDVPALFTITEEETIVATCKYQSATRISEV